MVNIFDGQIKSYTLNADGKSTTLQNPEKFAENLTDEEINSYKEKEIYDFLLSSKGKGETRTRNLLAKYLMSRYIFKTFSDNGEIIVNKEDYSGIYSLDGDVFISKEIQRIAGDLSSTTLVMEITNIIRRETYINRDVLQEQPKNLIPLNNGLFDIEKRVLLPHEPGKYIFISKIPIDYKEHAECPKFMKFLKEVLPDKKQRQLAMEWAGYCLLNDTRFQKACLLYGSGSNGKSVLMRVIERVLGRENVTKISLQDLESNTFAAARLFGKKANIFFDLPKKSLIATSKFKMISSGDPLTAEKKGKDSFEFTCTAKLMFSCNEIPRSPDLTPAFFRRWIILPFNRVFDSSNMIQNLEEQFFVKQELEGILQWMLHGLMTHLFKNHGFTETMSQAEIEEFWIQKTDNVISFFRDAVLIDPLATEGVSKHDLYEHYISYCNVRGSNPEYTDVFFKRLQERWAGYEETQVTEQKDKRIRKIRGIRLKQILSAQPTQPFFYTANNRNNNNSIYNNSIGDQVTKWLCRVGLE